MIVQNDYVRMATTTRTDGRTVDVLHHDDMLGIAHPLGPAAHVVPVSDPNMNHRTHDRMESTQNDDVLFPTEMNQKKHSCSSKLNNHPIEIN